MNNDKLREALIAVHTVSGRIVEACPEYKYEMTLVNRAVNEPTAPAPVDDEALAEAIARLDAGDTSCLLTDSVEVLAALRAAQQEVAELRERLNIILTDSTYEGGVRYWIHKHDQLLKLLPAAIDKARAAGEGKGAT